MPEKKTTKTHESAQTDKPKTAKSSTNSPEGQKKTSRSRKPKVGENGEVLPHLRIRIRAHEHKILDSSLKQIMDTAARYDAQVHGPVPLPTEIKKYTVNRSSFIDKNSREQFEMRVHKRLIDIVNPNPKVIEALRNMSLPSGVNIDVKMM